MIVFHKSCLYNYFARQLTCKFYYKNQLNVLLSLSMWTGIAPLCSSGFVIDKIVLDRVMPQFELCCTVFALQLSSLLELVGVIDPVVCFCCCFCQLALLFTLAFFRAQHLATQFLTLLPLFLQFFCLDKDRFCSLAFFASWLFVLIAFCCLQ